MQVPPGLDRLPAIKLVEPPSLQLRDGKPPQLVYTTATTAIHNREVLNGATVASSTIIPVGSVNFRGDHEDLDFPGNKWSELEQRIPVEGDWGHVREQWQMKVHAMFTVEWGDSIKVLAFAPLWGGSVVETEQYNLEQGVPALL